MLGKLINTCHICTARMSPALNGSYALQRFECSNAIEIRNEIMFDFYPGLPHIVHLSLITAYLYSTYFGRGGGCDAHSLVPRACAFIACSTKFAQRAWARSSRDVCHSRIFTSAQCLPCCLYTCTMEFQVETSQVRTIDYSRKL